MARFNTVLCLPLLIALATPVHAQSDNAQAATGNKQDGAGRTPLGPPTVQKSADCNSYVPANARATATTITTLAVHITVGGRWTNPKLVKSSGRADLDNAAIACVSAYPFGFTDKTNLNQFEYDWTLQVHWELPQVFPLPSDDGSFHVCGLRHYPSFAARHHEEGTTIVHFEIGTNGLVRNVIVMQTSGYSDLDDASVTCVSQWHYPVATRSGEPVALEWASSMVWALR